MATEKKWYTAREAAKVLGVSRQYIYDLIWTEKLPYTEKEVVRMQKMIKADDLDKIDIRKK